MKTLLLMRHAKSSWRDGDLGDHERPLNARGERAAPWMGRWLRDQGISLDQVVTSSAVRAVDTAKAVTAELGYEGSLIVTPRLYMAEPTRYFEVLSEVDPSLNSVLILGHNPGVSETASLLTGVDLDMPTAGLAWISLDVESFDQVNAQARGTLVQFQRPPKDEKTAKDDKPGKSSKKGKS